MSAHSWAGALDFYASFTGSQWCYLRRFGELVERVSQSDQAIGLTAVTSMHDLVVSPYTRYPDWFEGRRVVLRPQPEGAVRIEAFTDGVAQQPQGHWVVPVDAATERILEQLSRL